jgi:hypothetical protein
MDVFPRSFLLVFAQLSVGGMLALAVPPFHEIQRGYYKSSGFVYVLLGTLALLGRLSLIFGRGETPAGSELAEMVAWTLFVSAASGYWATLWSERFALRARLFTASLLSGLIALLLASEFYRSAPFFSLQTIVLPVSFVLSAVALGATSGGMLLGHWYLIDRNLSLAPLHAMLALYAWSLALQAVVLLAALVLNLAGLLGPFGGVEQLFASHRGALTARLLASPIGAGILAEMIRRTLRIPQTMAATGLFYIAVLAVLMGEMLGRYLLFRTGVPL